MKSMELDEIDRRILRALQDDALLSHAKLAERVGSSSASCWRRVRSLEATGVLGKAVRLLDPAKENCRVNVLCSVRMSSPSGDATAAFQAFVNERPELKTGRAHVCTP